MALFNKRNAKAKEATTAYFSQGEILEQKLTRAQKREAAVTESAAMLYDETTLSHLLDNPDVNVLVPNAGKGDWSVSNAGVRVTGARLKAVEQGLDPNDPQGSMRTFKQAFGDDAHYMAATVSYAATQSAKGDKFAAALKGNLGLSHDAEAAIRGVARGLVAESPQQMMMQANLVKNAADQGRMAWTPTTAATVQRALDMQYYESMHNPGLSDEERQTAAEKYQSRSSTLREQITSDLGDKGIASFEHEYMQQIAVAAEVNPNVRDRYTGMSLGAIQISKTPEGPVLSNPDGSAFDIKKLQVRPVQTPEEILAQHYANTRGLIEAEGPTSAKGIDQSVGHRSAVAYSEDAAQRLIDADAPMYGEKASMSLHTSDFGKHGKLSSRAIVYATTNEAVRNYAVESGVAINPRKFPGLENVAGVTAESQMTMQSLAASVPKIALSQPQAMPLPQRNLGAIPTSEQNAPRMEEPPQPQELGQGAEYEQPAPQPAPVGAGGQAPEMQSAAPVEPSAAEQQAMAQTEEMRAHAEQVRQEMQGGGIGQPMPQQVSPQPVSGGSYQIPPVQPASAMYPPAVQPMPVGYQQYQQSAQSSPEAETLKRLLKAHPELAEEAQQYANDVYQRRREDAVHDVEHAKNDVAKEAVEEQLERDAAEKPVEIEAPGPTGPIHGIEVDTQPIAVQNQQDAIKRMLETAAPVEVSLAEDNADFFRMSRAQFDDDIESSGILQNMPEASHKKQHFYNRVQTFADSCARVIEQHPEMLPEGQSYDEYMASLGIPLQSPSQSLEGRHDDKKNNLVGTYIDTVHALTAMHEGLSDEQRAAFDADFAALCPDTPQAKYLEERSAIESVRSTSLGRGVFADEFDAGEQFERTGDRTASLAYFSDGWSESGKHAYVVEAARALYSAKSPMFSDLEAGDKFAEALKSGKYQECCEMMVAEWGSMSVEEQVAAEQRHAERNGFTYEPPTIEIDGVKHLVDEKSCNMMTDDACLSPDDLHDRIAKESENPEFAAALEAAYRDPGITVEDVPPRTKIERQIATLAEKGGFDVPYITPSYMATAISAGADYDTSDLYVIANAYHMSNPEHPDSSIEEFLEAYNQPAFDEEGLKKQYAQDIHEAYLLSQSAAARQHGDMMFIQDRMNSDFEIQALQAEALAKQAEEQAAAEKDNPELPVPAEPETEMPVPAEPETETPAEPPKPAPVVHEMPAKARTERFERGISATSDAPSIEHDGAGMDGPGVKG